MGVKRGPKIYKYHDGNGNTYIIKNEDKTFIEYIPMKPSLSSSGDYDGGNYSKKEISKLEFDKIELALNDAIINTKIHIKNRIKMSGMITIQEQKHKKVYILAPNSKEIIKIEKFLKNLC